MLELMIHLDGSSKRPLYGQIYDYIRTHIADGKISHGEKLPSTRLLSTHLQVARSTVELAYEQLLSEGYIESKPCRGYYAADISDLYLGTKAAVLDALPGQKRQTPSETEDKYRIDFSPDENEYAYFPYGAWRKISKEILSMDDPSLLTVGSAAGEWELREEICRYLYQARGVNAQPKQMIIGAGNEYLLMLLAQVLGKNKRVAIENPTYLKAYHTLANMGYDMLPLSRDSWGIQMKSIRAQAPDVVYTMPSHQFPMGTVMPMKRRLELLQWASEQEGRYIIEDDHDSEFRYKGKPIPSLQGNDVRGTVIYLGTFSKSLSPAMRVSYLALPETLLDAYQRRCGFYASTVPKEQQRVLAALLNQGYFERYLNKMRRIYKAKHDEFLALLKKEAWIRQIYGDHAGMHLLAELHTKKDTACVVEAAKKRGVRVYALEEYMVLGTNPIPNSRPTLLLGYGALSRQKMQEGVACIRGILK